MPNTSEQLEESCAPFSFNTYNGVVILPPCFPAYTKLTRVTEMPREFSAERHLYQSLQQKKLPSLPKEKQRSCKKTTCDHSERCTLFSTALSVFFTLPLRSTVWLQRAWKLLMLESSTSWRLAHQKQSCSGHAGVYSAQEGGSILYTAFFWHFLCQRTARALPFQMGMLL